jgi:hypothetical protein
MTPTHSRFAPAVAANLYLASACAIQNEHAIYEQARTATLHERLANGPRISDDELVNEHYRLKAATYRAEEDLLLSDMRRFVTEEATLSSPRPSFISRAQEFVRLVGDKFK